jgi:hypothetical protein
MKKYGMTYDRSPETAVQLVQQKNKKARNKNNRRDDRSRPKEIAMTMNALSGEIKSEVLPPPADSQPAVNGAPGKEVSVIDVLLETQRLQRENNRMHGLLADGLTRFNKDLREELAPEVAALNGFAWGRRWKANLQQALVTSAVAAAFIGVAMAVHAYVSGEPEELAELPVIPPTAPTSKKAA